MPFTPPLGSAETDLGVERGALEEREEEDEDEERSRALLLEDATSV